MFKVKQYDLGDQLEQVGYYQDVVDEMQEKKNNPMMTKSTKYKYEVPAEVKQKVNQDKSVARSKTKIRRMAKKYRMKYMWTLTFAKKEGQTVNAVTGKVNKFDAGNYDDVWKIWKSFLKRCKRAGLEFNYIVTVEVQEKRLAEKGEKVYHFHFITDQNIPINAVKAKQAKKPYHMNMLWVHGYSFVTYKKSNKNAHLYIVKYLAKLIDELGTGRQRYRCNQGLVIQPVIVTYQDHVDFLMSNKDYAVRNNYSVLGKVLEVFWQIVDKGEMENEKTVFGT